ncbi:MAG: SH3 domain-containing protein [Pseudomonadota bacterium]
MRRAVVLSAILLMAPITSAKELGDVTNLPLPRYVSMKAEEGYARRGPSQGHRIDWIFKHRHTPLRITGEYEHWRRVEDVDGQGGWMHFRLLSGVRTVLITDDAAALKRRGYEDSQIVAKLEKGVIGFLKECAQQWCKISVDGKRGWLPKSQIWGVGADEIRN